jgi:hypothetical protein
VGTIAQGEVLKAVNERSRLYTLPGVFVVKYFSGAGRHYHLAYIP